MTQEAYNGWPNFDTWNTNLWIDNDEWAYIKVHAFIMFQITRQVSFIPEHILVAEFSSWVRIHVFGTKTPDEVRLLPKYSKVDWQAIIDNGWQEKYTTLRDAWLPMLREWEQAPRAGRGTREQLVAKFKAAHGYTLQQETTAQRYSSLYPRLQKK